MYAYENEPDAGEPLTIGATALPCIVCGRELDNIAPGVNQPSDGLSFTTYGHYGSCLFDEIGAPPRRYLTVTICDPCAYKAARSGRVALVRERPSQRPEPDVRRWTPGEAAG